MLVTESKFSAKISDIDTPSNVRQSKAFVMLNASDIVGSPINVFICVIGTTRVATHTGARCIIPIYCMYMHT